MLEKREEEFKADAVKKNELKEKKIALARKIIDVNSTKFARKLKTENVLQILQQYNSQGCKRQTKILSLRC